MKKNNKLKLLTLTWVVFVSVMWGTFASQDPSINKENPGETEVVVSVQEMLNDYKLKTIDKLNYYLFGKMKKLSLAEKKRIYPKMFEVIKEADQEFDKQIINKYFALQEAWYKTIDVRPWCYKFVEKYKKKIDQEFNKLVKKDNIVTPEQKVQERFNKYKKKIDILLEKNIKDRFDKLPPEKTLKQYEELLIKIKNLKQKFKTTLDKATSNKIKEKYMLIIKILDYIEKKVQYYKESMEQVLNLIK